MQDLKENKDAIRQTAWERRKKNIQDWNGEEAVALSIKENCD